MSKIILIPALALAILGLAIFVKLERDKQSTRTPGGGPEAAAVDGQPAGGDPDPATGAVPPPAPEPIQLSERLSGEEFRRLTDRTIANLRMIPVAAEADPVSFLWPSTADDAPAALPTLEYARQATFPSWKSYADEHIGFYYPDASGIEVEVVGPDETVPVFARHLLRRETGAFRRYRITAGSDGTLALISISRADRFDDAPRSPQPEVFHRYYPSGDGLLRASLTENGQVRRAELLGKDLRVSLLDWPHTAAHQDIYLRLATGIQLQPPHADLADLQARVRSQFGFEGRLGLLDPGMFESDIVQLLGAPLARDTQRGALQYLHDDGSGEILYTLTIRDGSFAGFAQGWREFPRSIPDEGTIGWMFEKTDYHAGPPGGIGYNLGPLTEADVEFIFNRVVQLSPNAGGQDWEQLCDVIINLAQHGLRDPRVIELLVVRLESGDDRADAAVRALVACGSDEARTAVAKYLVNRLAAPAPEPETLEQLDTLLGFVGKRHADTPAILERSFKHDSNGVRELAFRHLDWIPEASAIAHLEAGLRDPSVAIRLRCANAFAQDRGEPARHAQLLQACLAEESDEQVKQLLQQALQRLGPPAGS